MQVCVKTVKKYPCDDYRSPVFIFERLCSIIFPVSSKIYQIRTNCLNMNVHYYNPLLKRKGGEYTVLPVSVHSSVCRSVHPSVVCPMYFFRRIFLRNYNTRISEIWFQGFYESALLCDAFSDSSLDNFLFTEHLYDFTHDSQVENFRHIFLRNYNTWISEIWFQGLYKSAIPCDPFSDSSLVNFLFTENLYNITHDSQVENFRHIFLTNYNTRIFEIWFQGLYKSAIQCDAFSDSSLDNFLFTEYLHIFTLLKLSTCSGGIISEQ